MRLRAIVVSTRAALRKVPSEADIIRLRAHTLLDELASEVRANGADATMLGEIETARREISIPGAAPGATEPDGGTTT